MIQTEDWNGIEVYKLETNNLAAWLCPMLGSNLFRLKDKKHGVEILHTPKNSQALIEKPVMYGTPVLFPPNRIAHGSFDYQGQHFRLPVNTPDGHHIHGLVMDRPWRFSSLSDADGIVSVTTTFDFADFPEILEYYPNNLSLSLTTTLNSQSCVQRFEVINRGHGDAPVGFGLHTWFHLGGGRTAWKISMPFESLWELGEDVMPTGTLLSNPSMDSLRTGIELKEKQFDTIFYVGSQQRRVILTNMDGYSIQYSASDEIRHWVLHTPSNLDDVIAIEPYSWVTNAPNLSCDHATSGFRAIKPNETFHCSVVLKIN